MTRILVVDDERQLRRALGVNLRARGYDVALAETGGRRCNSLHATTPMW